MSATETTGDLTTILAAERVTAERLGSLPLHTHQVVVASPAHMAERAPWGNGDMIPADSAAVAQWLAGVEAGDDIFRADGLTGQKYGSGDSWQVRAVTRPGLDGSLQEPMLTLLQAKLAVATLLRAGVDRIDIRQCSADRYVVIW